MIAAPPARIDWQEAATFPRSPSDSAPGNCAEMGLRNPGVQPEGLAGHALSLADGLLHIRIRRERREPGVLDSTADREVIQALADATDAVQAAVDDYAREATLQARTAVHAAVNDYVQRLSPVIGQVEAFRYEASLRTHQNAIDRVETLNSRLSALPFLDTADRKLLRQLNEEQAAAAQAFKAARVALDTALKGAKARDNEPDEKDGA